MMGENQNEGKDKHMRYKQTFTIGVIQVHTEDFLEFQTKNYIQWEYSLWMAAYTLYKLCLCQEVFGHLQNPGKNKQVHLMSEYDRMT